MKIYTKTGDKGQTSLANGQRVSKTDVRIAAYGTADELNSVVGLLRSKLDDQQFAWVQNKLFNLGAYLAGAEGEWINQIDVTQLEQWMDEMQAMVQPQHAFVLPGGSESIALCHVCRTITRRLERAMWQIDGINELCVQWVNRLSDYWFLKAQIETQRAKITPFYWKK
ncbi:MAG: cob(I)yrinic acid a,c-diamide adenosyltransferase [Paludibacteraceae bacterium]|nr:cob(I)yrinic acid a,c-diamide adenosyltransferase [Paludibacteraceae bacterium]